MLDVGFWMEPARSRCIDYRHPTPHFKNEACASDQRQPTSSALNRMLDGKTAALPLQRLPSFNSAFKNRSLLQRSKTSKIQHPTSAFRYIERGCSTEPFVAFSRWLRLLSFTPPPSKPAFRWIGTFRN